MNVREFLKTCGGATIGSLVLKDTNATAEELLDLSIEVVPLCVEDKCVVISIGNYSLRVMCTSHILLKHEDMTYSTNPYNTFFKIIGEAREKNKSNASRCQIVRFESQAFIREDLDKVWNIELRKIVRKFRDLNMTQYSCDGITLPKVISI